MFRFQQSAGMGDALLTGALGGAFDAPGSAISADVHGHVSPRRRRARRKVAAAEAGLRPAFV